MRQFFKLAFAAVVLCLPYVVFASPIVQDVENGAAQIQYFEPIGQSFIAEDPFVSIGFFLDVMNPSFPVSDITMTLVDGEGAGGSILSSHTFSPGAAFAGGYYDVNFADVALTIGQKYSALLSIPGDSPYWGIEDQSGWFGDLYSGGHLLSAIPIFGIDLSVADARFRILPVDAPTNVPEPMTFSLLAIGIAGLLLGRRSLKI